jgi:predicted small lipoprotein YifL
MPVKRMIAVMGIALTLAACGPRPPVGYPLAKDVQAMVERKPAPTEDILTDPNASARYNASIEAWGDRISSAAGIVCRNLVSQGMTGVDCPAK